MIKIIPGLLLMLSSVTFSLPLLALNENQEEQQKYCKGWATRFLTLKNGSNYTLELHGKYVSICTENYVELRNYYKSLNNKVNK